VTASTVRRLKDCTDWSIRGIPFSDLAE
jgi:hypothetical protein